MNYTELQAAVEDVMECTFETDVMSMLTKQAEQLAYQAVQPPALRKVGTVTFIPDNPVATLPDDFLYPLSFAVVVSNVWLYLLNKDVNFIREAYPNPTTTGVPAH